MVETVKEEVLYSTQSDPRCAALSTELEATRAAFHRLVETSSTTGWHRKSPASAWTLGEVCVHLAWALEHLPEEVERARRGRGMFNLPKWLADPLSYWYIRGIARAASPDSVLRRYDQAMDASIQLLETIPGEDWKKGADFYGEGFHSVEDLFHSPACHLLEHTSGL